jgi:hypothetical protein
LPGLLHKYNLKIVWFNTFCYFDGAWAGLCDSVTEKSFRSDSVCLYDRKDFSFAANTLPVARSIEMTTKETYIS